MTCPASDGLAFIEQICKVLDSGSATADRIAETTYGSEVIGAEAVRVGLICNTALAAVKIGVYCFTGSAAIFADLMHSVADVANYTFAPALFF